MKTNIDGLEKVFGTKKHSIYKSNDGNYYICVHNITDQQIVYYDLNWLINYANELNDGFELPDECIYETHNYVVYENEDNNYVCVDKEGKRKHESWDSEFCIDLAKSSETESEEPKIEILYENSREKVYRNPEGRYCSENKKNGSKRLFDDYDKCIEYANLSEFSQPKTKGEILAEMLKEYEAGNISEEEFIQSAGKK